MELHHSDVPEFVINKPYGDLSIIPEGRSYAIEFIGYESCDEFKVTEDGEEREYSITEENGCIVIENIKGTVVITFGKSVRVSENDRKTDAINFIRKYQGENDIKKKLYSMITGGETTASVFRCMMSSDMDDNAKNAIAEILMSDSE